MEVEVEILAEVEVVMLVEWERLCTGKKITTFPMVLSCLNFEPDDLFKLLLLHDVNKISDDTILSGFCYSNS